MKNNLKDLSLKDLALKLDEMQRELFSLKLEDLNTGVKDKSQFRILRKNIARALTFMRLKQ